MAHGDRGGQGAGRDRGDDKENHHENESRPREPPGARLCKPPEGASRERELFIDPSAASTQEARALRMQSLGNLSARASDQKCSSEHLGKDGQGIKVFVRIRPLPPELAAEARMHEHQGTYSKDCSPVIYSHSQKPGRIMVSSDEDGERERLQYFDFDGVFDERYANSDVWREVGSAALQHFLNGMDAAIFSFGPTGSGKTYTMQGRVVEKRANSMGGAETAREIEPLAAEGDHTASSGQGLCSRAFSEIARALGARGQASSPWVCRCSAVEIYNDQ